jgi:hypothetical protein
MQMGVRCARLTDQDTNSERPVGFLPHRCSGICRLVHNIPTKRPLASSLLQ